MLVLQKLFDLNDANLECQVKNRWLFDEFIGLGVMNAIPEETTVTFFREYLRKDGVIENLFDRF